MREVVRAVKELPPSSVGADGRSGRIVNPSPPRVSFEVRGEVPPHIRYIFGVWADDVTDGGIPSAVTRTLPKEPTS